jgi:hypothetical protein
MATFNGLALFASGPHRVVPEGRGMQLVSKLSQGTLEPGSIAIGLKELKVFIRGRLVGTTESELTAARDAILAEITSPSQVGSVMDDYGREWEDMAFIEYREVDLTDRGRVRSVAYECEFRRMV